MKQFPVQELKLRDTVMVEVSIGRYRIKKDMKDTGVGRKYGWMEWRAYLELRSISLIHRDPPMIEHSYDHGEPVRI
jgi:hypothetical protein